MDEGCEFDIVGPDGGVASSEERITIDRTRPMYRLRRRQKGVPVITHAVRGNP